MDRQGDPAGSGGSHAEALMVAAAIFIGLNYALTRLARLLELRVLARRGGARPPAAADPMLTPAAAGGGFPASAGPG